MQRELSPEAARAILARESGQVFQPLLEITGPGLEPIWVEDLDEEGPFDTFARLDLKLVQETEE